MSAAVLQFRHRARESAPTPEPTVLPLWWWGIVVLGAALFLWWFR